MTRKRSKKRSNKGVFRERQCEECRGWHSYHEGIILPVRSVFASHLEAFLCDICYRHWYSVDPQVSMFKTDYPSKGSLKLLQKGGNNHDTHEIRK